MDKLESMSYYVERLNEAAKAYYMEDREIMSNYEYDAMFDDLRALERETGIVLPNSPTSNVGYEVISKLEKTTHEFPALSLDKLKDRDELKRWLGNRKGCLSWKMDGLTIVAEYLNGNLVKVSTRGNGYTGEICTHNSKFFRGLPQKIDYKGKLVIRGEAIMTQKEFERINSHIVDVKAKYKNPRNLASATVRLYDSEEASHREIRFYAFNLVYKEDDFSNSFFTNLDWLNDHGFNVVVHHLVDKNNLLELIESMEKDVQSEANGFPSDGLVLIYDDIEYGKSLGSTGHHAKNGMAFKWQDETVETTIRDVEWSASRTGLLNPVAIFDPVELEGTTVSRASVHNVSILKSMHISVNSVVKVYKANMIIPQIAENISPIGDVVIPSTCPVCDGETRVHLNPDDDVETLYCTNPDCIAKHIGVFVHFASRDAMNIIGLSRATLEQLIDEGFVHEFADLYHLDRHRDDIIQMDGFGPKSYENLVASIEASRSVKFASFLTAIGIPGIGKDMAKVITKSLGSNPLQAFVDKLRMGEGFDNIEGVGPVINDNIYKWKENRQNGEVFANIVDELTFLPEETSFTDETSSFFGKTFVVTGSVEHFKNRDEVKEYIEKKGGKVAGSVSAKTSFLVNNDINSNSGKNKKAKELGVTIVTEQELLDMH